MPAAGSVRRQSTRQSARQPARESARRYGTTALAVVATLAAVAMGAGPADAVTIFDTEAAVAVGVPATPKDLPEEVEEASPYIRQVSCDPSAKPGAVALGKLLVATYPGTSYSIVRECGGDGIASEHYEGRAVDWMVSVRDSKGQARATALIDWLLAEDDDGHKFANARRLGVMYIIWNDHIWGSYADDEGWRKYSTCEKHPEKGWDTNCHRDHVHLSLSWSGALGRTSYWTKDVADTDYGPCRPKDLNWAPVRTKSNDDPCPSYPTVTAPSGASSTLASVVRYSGAVVGQGSVGPVVKAVQAGLGITADGQFGPGTAGAVSDFRRSQKLSAGTRLDADTWRALIKVVTAASPPTAAGSTPGKPTTSAPKTEEGESPTAGRPAVRNAALTPYRNTVLQYGSKGPAVIAVQKALKVKPVSGWYGPATKTAVIAFQKAHKIPTTGNVGPLTWKALGA